MIIQKWYTLISLMGCMCLSTFAGESSSPLPATQVAPKAEKIWSDLELKQLGDNCYGLPYALWIHTLNFLLGTRHEIVFGIDPQAISDLRQSNKVTIDNHGRLVACYHNNMYSWNPYGRHVTAKRAWNNYTIPKGWSFDRIEHGSVVLLNSAHDAVKILDEESFKEQAQHTIPKNSYFNIANRGRTLVYCAHPILTKAPITSMRVTHASQEHDAKVRYASCVLRMPHGGVMPPITLDENGTFLAAHATERDEVYIFDIRDIHKAPSQTPKMLKLSNRCMDAGTEYYSAIWILKNPQTQTYDEFLAVLRNNQHAPQGSELVINVNNPTVTNKQGYPHKPQNFFQFNRDPITSGVNKMMQTGDLDFVRGKAEGALNLISLSQTIDQTQEGDEKEKKSYSSCVLNYWDITKGQSVRSITLKTRHCSIVTYAAAKSGHVMFSNGREHYLASPASQLEELFSGDQEMDQSSNSLVSPAGNWVFTYSHIPTSGGDKTPYILMLPMVFYLGSERMKRITTEVPKAYRTFIMRLYALQHGYFCNSDELLPPPDMRTAIGMEKIDSGGYVRRASAQNRKDGCVIS